MIKPFEFYFDFSSPYSYLAHKKIQKIENENKIKIRYMPIFLGGLHNLTGINPPGLIPIKAMHMIKDCKLWADKEKVTFKFNTYFPIKTVNLMRGVLIAEKENFSKIFINKVFESIWQDGLNLNDQIILEKLLKNLNINPKLFFEKVQKDEIKNDLKDRTSNAYKKGIFGAPTFVINNKIFWGQDRLEFVLNEAKKK